MEIFLLFHNFTKELCNSPLLCPISSSTDNKFLRVRIVGNYFIWLSKIWSGFTKYWLYMTIEDLARLLKISTFQLLLILDVFKLPHQALVHYLHSLPWWISWFQCNFFSMFSLCWWISWFQCNFFSMIEVGTCAINN